MSRRIHSTKGVVVELLHESRPIARVRIIRLLTSEMLVLTLKEWLDLRDSILASPDDDAW